MDPIDPVDPAFLERSFDNRIPGPSRVERVRELHDDQPGESWEEEQQHAQDETTGGDEDFYEPSHPAGKPIGEPSNQPGGDPPDDEDSVVVELDHTAQAEQRSDPGSDEDSDGPHIDISV